jgi:hypothetical protein
MAGGDAAEMRWNMAAQMAFFSTARFRRTSGVRGRVACAQQIFGGGWRVICA